MRGIIILAVVIFAEICCAQTPGDDCANPIPVSLNTYYEPYWDNNYTCGRGNNEENTCLDYYDGGEDIFYEINVEAAALLNFQLNPLSTYWTGMALSTDCPPSGSSPEDCLAYSHSHSSSNIHGFSVYLEEGTYYLMIDTWPTPDCIPEFELTINDALFDYWGTCELPFYLILPDNAPFEDSSQSTCSGYDNYSNTCLGYYDGGRDLTYMLDITRPGNVIVRLDPTESAYTGIALGNTCPPSTEGGGECLAVSTSILPQPHGFDLDLPIGIYFLTVDTWPEPECIPHYNLSISFWPEKLCGDVNDDFAVNVSDAVYLINHIFIGGDAPVIYSSGDVNCDDLTNVSDAVMIINYVFSGGNIPCDPDGNDIPDC